jgi:chromosomal replication initiation ATPase DnaA
VPAASWGEVVRQHRFVTTPREHRREIILGVCAKHGVTLNVILSPSRDLKATKARHEAIFAVNQAYPKLGTSALGRLFHRNHATIAYVLGKRGLRTPKKRKQRCQTGHSENSRSSATT